MQQKIYCCAFSQNVKLKKSVLKIPGLEFFKVGEKKLLKRVSNTTENMLHHFVCTELTSGWNCAFESLKPVLHCANFAAAVPLVRQNCFPVFSAAANAKQCSQATFDCSKHMAICHSETGWFCCMSGAAARNRRRNSYHVERLCSVCCALLLLLLFWPCALIKCLHSATTSGTFNLLTSF